MELVTIKAKTRGKNTREVEYKGIGKFVGEGEDRRLVTDGVLTEPKDALALVNGDTQKMLDYFAVGFNLEAYKQVSDALAEYIEDSWDDAQVKAFRLTVNALRNNGLEVEQAVSIAKNTPALKAKAA
jgi:hypothetical protein